MDDDANRLLELSKGWPHPLDRGDRLIEVKITLIDSSLQMDDHTNRLLGLSKGWPHLPERGDRLIEVNITMVKEKQI